MPERHTFSKSERLCSQKAVEALFGHGGESRGFTVWPLRAVWCPKPGLPATQVLVVAPKRRLRHAVDRNRAKRQVREAYRLQKQLLSRPAHLALVWTADTPVPSRRVHDAVRRILLHFDEL